MDPPVDITLVYTGTYGCGNCTRFNREWEAIVSRTGSSPKAVEGVRMSFVKYMAHNHSGLPLALQRTVPFYPFLLLVPTQYLDQNINRDVTLVGEAMHAYKKKRSDGEIVYSLCQSVNDSPSMRYPRSEEGVTEWIWEMALDSLSALAPRYYNGLEIPSSVAPATTSLRMSEMNLSVARELFVLPSVNREYIPLGDDRVLCRKIRSLA